MIACVKYFTPERKEKMVVIVNVEHLRREIKP